MNETIKKHIPDYQKWDMAIKRDDDGYIMYRIVTPKNDKQKKQVLDKCSEKCYNDCDNKNNFLIEKSHDDWRVIECSKNTRTLLECMKLKFKAASIPLSNRLIKEINKPKAQTFIEYIDQVDDLIGGLLTEEQIVIKIGQNENLKKISNIYQIDEISDIKSETIVGYKIAKDIYVHKSFKGDIDYNVTMSPPGLCISPLFIEKKEAVAHGFILSNFDLSEIYKSELITPNNSGIKIIKEVSDKFRDKNIDYRWWDFL